MSKPISAAFSALVLVALLGLGADVHAQASNVNCSRCVDAGDIAPEAVTTGKIANRAVTSKKIESGAVTNGKIANRAVTTKKINPEAVTTGKIQDGAVTVDKVALPLKNAIGTFCAPGQFVVGMDATGNFVCEPRYFPFGPQLDVPEGTLSGWTHCYEDLYENSGTTTLESILAQCDGSKLLLACRPVGDSNFTLLAAAPREDVVFDTGIDSTTTHSANGSEWYFNDAHSWGFAAQGQTVNKNNCDVNSPDPQNRRLCWHAFDGLIDGGYRCGVTTSLNGSTDWERHIFHAD